jgi:hypothetical protein
LKADERQDVGGKGVREVMERVEWTKVKYTHSRDTLRNPFEYRQILIMKDRSVN